MAVAYVAGELITSILMANIKHAVSNANLVFGVCSNLIFYLGVTTELKKPILNSILESSEVEKVTNLWPLNT